MMGSMLEILILQIPCTWNADCTLCMWEVWCFMTETWAIKTKVSRGWSVLRWAWWSRCAIQYSDPFLITFAISIYSLLSTFYDHFTSLTLLFYSLTLCLKASVTCQLKLALFFSLSFYCSCIYWVFSLTFFFKPLSNLFCWWKKKKSIMQEHLTITYTSILTTLIILLFLTTNFNFLLTHLTKLFKN